MADNANKAAPALLEPYLTLGFALSAWAHPLLSMYQLC